MGQRTRKRLRVGGIIGHLTNQGEILVTHGSNAGMDECEELVHLNCSELWVGEWMNPGINDGHYK